MTAAEAIAVCRALAKCSEESGATTRTFLSPPMRAVHARLTGLMQRAGMQVTVDAAGNLRGLFPGTSADAGRWVIGSHLDTVRNAGAYDGVLGVVLGIAIVNRLRGRRLPAAIEVIGFSEEEGVRFGVPFIGSRALAGTLDDHILERRDANGISVRDAIVAFGLNPDRLQDARLERDACGYLELHIEQGPVLEALDAPLGVVNAIAGQSRLAVTFDGRANHAGTTPMDLRQDALAGAAEWINRVEAATRPVAGLVATVGCLDVSPGVANVIPGSCRATLDVRHAEDRTRETAVQALIATARDVATARRLTVTVEPRLDQPAVPMDGQLRGRLEGAIARNGYPLHIVASGAGHDAMMIAPWCPSAMLLMRTPGGISHHPDETVRVGDVDAAIKTGLTFIEDVTRNPPDGSRVSHRA